MPQYAFNEPEFVTWWLGSLYLFPMEDQVAIANHLRASVHEPDVQAEIDGFVAYTSGAWLVAAGESPAVDESGAAVARFALAKIREMFRASPWLVGFGVAGLLFAAVQGAWIVAKGFLGIVF